MGLVPIQSTFHSFLSVTGRTMISIKLISGFGNLVTCKYTGNVILIALVDTSS